MAVQRPAISLPRPLPRLAMRWWVAALSAALLLVALAQVNQFSRLTSTGYEMESLRRVREEKLAVNHQLQADVAQLSSLARVDWEARTRLRMEPPRRRLYINVNQPPPEVQRLPTRYMSGGSAPASPAPGAESQAWWQRLLDLLPF
jgi:hypothetical protein